ncbi:MAG: recombinase family protein [Deltaproteobacteria bacterium]|nr:recombinase family protein [Deltaproteobacteria bacterium]
MKATSNPTRTLPPKARTSRRAVIYLRVSTDEQAESGLGLEAQEAAARRFCEAQGLVIAAVHRDEAVSGTVPADKRPGLTAALADLGRGAVLVAAKRDRIARSVGIAAVVEETARRVGATVATPDAPDADDPFAGAMRGMMDVFAALERALIAARTKAALAAKKARGEKTGGSVPVGFEVAPDGRKLVAAEGETAALEAIQRLAAEGMSVRAIALRLNADGVRARGKQWHPTTIARVLKRTA